MLSGSVGCRQPQQHPSRPSVPWSPPLQGSVELAELAPQGHPWSRPVYALVYRRAHWGARSVGLSGNGMVAHVAMARPWSKRSLVQRPRVFKGISKEPIALGGRAEPSAV